MSILILTGCPGSGKTTVGRVLANRAEHGVHLLTDRFYEWLAHPIDPTLPASREQNETVVRAFSAAARELQKGGYDVIVDGIVGPWMLPIVQAELRGGLRYVVLRTELEQAVGRGGARPETPVERRVVEAMHPAFESLGLLEAHALEVADRSPDALADEIQRDPERWLLDPAP